MNQVTLIGTLPRDPHMIEPSGDNEFPIALFSVACRHDDLASPNYPSVKAFDELAVLANDLLQKGTKVRVEGYIRSESWTPKGRNAKKVYRDVIVALSVAPLADTRPLEDDPHAEALAELDAPTAA